MQAIGDTLREARMRQKIDIADVETSTKIRAKYLRALENEEFGLLPGPTFVRTFLRTYAEYLGLDPHLLVEEYRAQYEPRDEPEMQTFAPHTRPGGGGRRPSRGGGGPSRLMLAAAAGVLLLAFLLVLGLTGENDNGDGGNQARNTTTERQTARRNTERTNARERRAGATPRRVKLRIAPQEATYVCIDNGAGKVLFEGVITEPQTWRGRRLRLNMGKATAAVRVNGKRVPIEPNPNPVGFDFTPRKRTELPLGQRPCA
jgi:cytoskeleton protein RodZ